MFAYCGNNPVNAVDYSGHEEVWWCWWLDSSGEIDDDPVSFVIADALDGVGTGGTSSTTTYSNYYSTSYTSTATSYYNSYPDPYYYSANDYSITTKIFDPHEFSTGRTVPLNLNEQIAMEVVKSDPASGKIILSSLGDGRLPTGTVKLSQMVYWTEGSAEIHYLFHAAYGYFDFKFK